MVLGLAPGCCTLLIWEYRYYSVYQHKSNELIWEYKYYSVFTTQIQSLNLGFKYYSVYQHKSNLLIWEYKYYSGPLEYNLSII